MSETLRIGEYLLVPRGSCDPHQWNGMVDLHEDGWWWHRTEWLDYCLAYNHGTDHSVAVLRGEELVGICPLIEERGHFLGGGNPLPCALYRVRLDEEDQITAVICGYVVQVSRRSRILTGEYMLTPYEHPMENMPIDDESSENIQFRTRMINLARPVSERRQEIRKSYRQFIDRRDFLGGDLQGLFDLYAALHREKYQSPRSDETYTIQNQWVSGQYARVYVYPSESSRVRQIDAASLWIVYKDRAYYASGVYTGKNLAHGLTWAALNDLSNRGVRWAELGWQGRARTEREKNVEFFKRGFGGTDWHVPAVRLYYGATERYQGTA